MKLTNNGIFSYFFMFVFTGIFLPVNVEAVSTYLWNVNTFEDFQSGDPESTSITSEGGIILAPQLKTIADTGESIAWSGYLAKDGSLWVGTGSDGKLFRVNKKGVITEIADFSDLEIHCITGDSKGSIYVGTAPRGEIYKVTKGKKPVLFVETGEQFVWDMVMDKKNNLYIATGDGGKIYKVSKNGEKEVFFDTEETHIMDLLYNNGYLYAGSYPNGLVYKFSLDGKAFMMFHSDLEEIHCMVMDRAGNLYVAGNPELSASKSGSLSLRGGGLSSELISSLMKSFSASTGDGQAPGKMNIGDTKEFPDKSSMESIYQMFSGSPFQGPDHSYSSKGGDKQGDSSRGAIYKILPTGTPTKFWECPEDYIMSMHATENNQLIVGAAGEGKLYLLDSLGNATTWIKTQEKQVLSIIPVTRDKYYVTCGNNGVIYEIIVDYRMEGIYVSDTFDSKTISQWGRIFWNLELPDVDKTAIYLRTRTGNSKTPDETWSEWSSRYNDATGKQVVSPPARYIQWQAKLLTFNRKITPVLKKVSIAYLQENLPPKISGLEVYSPWEKNNSNSKKNNNRAGSFSNWISEKLEQSFKGSSNQGSKKRFSPSIRKVKWQVQDPNKDVVITDVYFRGEDESNWKLLQEHVKKKSIEWDTYLVPDGIYRIKIVCSDRLVNPRKISLDTEKVSEAFIVDNTAPDVAKIKALKQDTGEYLITGMVKDKIGIISRIEISIDAGEWEIVFPDDNIFDSPRESFSFITKPLIPGEHVVIVRVTDSSGNVGAGKNIFKSR